MTPAATTEAPDRGSFPGFGEDAPLDVPGIGSPTVAEGLAARIADGSWSAFADAAASVGYCSRPIRLRGSSATVDARTGEVLSTFRSQDAPLGVLHRRCGNRRAHVCPSCSRLYARDTFEMIRAGVQGGKQVPDQVAGNPLLFLTVTAPSFGLVHGTRPNNGVCRPRRRDDRTRCQHGRPTWCHRRHTGADLDHGAPLCGDCYDYQTHVIWQWWAPELWRRLTMQVRRALAHHLGVTESWLGDRVSVQYAKVAEYQARGVVHFHALIRLDGPKHEGIGAPAPQRIDAATLAGLIREAVGRVSFTAPPAGPGDPARILRFGSQVDVRTVREGSRTDDPAGPVTPGQVAGYLAKYATKDADDTEGRPRRRTPHLYRIKDTCARLHAASREVPRPEGEADPYRLLVKWEHMLGFRGHFSTKSRRYSITLGALRRARARFQALIADAARTGQPLDTADLEARLLADEDEQATTLVLGDWTYVGTGWDNPADAALATAAAARAREYHQWKANQDQSTNSTASRRDQ